MSRALEPVKRSEPNLIDRIANALPQELRADYYRELRHCRSLPENDEMLRILRAMQFLTLLTHQVPERMVGIREALDRRLDEVMATIARWIELNEANQQSLDERLIQLPATVANGINPDAIASSINESLRQRFVQSTIPETAAVLAGISRELQKTTVEFGKRAKSLGDSYNGAAEEARTAIRDLESAVSEAAEAGKRAAESLAWTFSRAYRWSVHSLCAIALVLGVLLGVAGERWLIAPTCAQDSGIQSSGSAPLRDNLKTKH
jgi:hypothetical protein